jgi:hypothetical protein
MDFNSKGITDNLVLMARLVDKGVDWSLLEGRLIMKNKTMAFINRLGGHWTLSALNHISQAFTTATRVLNEARKGSTVHLREHKNPPLPPNDSLLQASSKYFASATRAPLPPSDDETIVVLDGQVPSVARPRQR